MPRPRRPDRERISLPLSESWWLWLCGVRTLDQLHDEGEEEAFEIFLDGPERERGLWEQHREVALQYIAAVTPGKRPHAWWTLDAPEPRRRVSGRMRKWWSRSAHQDASPWAYQRNGEYGFWFEGPDPGDPPKLESEATFLRRHNLFLPREAARLRPRDYRPEPEFDPAYLQVASPDAG